MDSVATPQRPHPVARPGAAGRAFHHGHLRQALIDAARTPGRRSSYDHLPAALLGLHRTGVSARIPDERDALFAWSAIYGAASLRNGRVPAALIPLPELAREVASRVVDALRAPTGMHCRPFPKETSR